VYEVVKICGSESEKKIMILFHLHQAAVKAQPPQTGGSIPFLE
jgi:hypothetical protein